MDQVYVVQLPHPEPFRFRHGVLLAATLWTTLYAGVLLLPEFYDMGILEHLRYMLHHPLAIFLGAPFAVPLLFILGVHEMGHFLTARRYGIRATWPYFIPGPPYLSLGTFGAFIRLKSPIATRGILMEVGAMGPLWGFGASVLVALLGFGLGLAGYHSPADLGMNVNLPLAFWALRGVMTHHWSHQLTFFENPVLLAAWIGFFVQGLNLIPIGQLDGGHVLYGFLRSRHRVVSLALGLVCLAFALFHPQWIIWVGLIFFVLGLRHPPCIDDSQPLSAAQVLLGLAAILMFVLCFLPIPFVWS